MQEKIVAGLDIGTTKICLVVGKLNSYNQLEILGYGSAQSDGVKEGVIVNLHKTVEGITAALKKAEEVSKTEIGIVNVGITGKHIGRSIHHGGITRKSSDDEITIDDVNRLTSDMYRTVTDPGTEIIHVVPQQYMVDFENNIKDPVA